MKENIQTIENLSREDAIRKMRELAESARVCHFVTRLHQIPLQTRPMSTQEVDNEGNFWFFSDDFSNKNFQIEDDSRVQLFYGNPSKSEFMTLYGHAMIRRDPQKVEQLWHPMVKAWFADKNDPSLTLLMVIPDTAYYWDTRNNRMVSLIKIMASVVSDKTREDGIEGTLKV